MNDVRLTGKLPREAIGALRLPAVDPALLEGFRALDDLSGAISDAMDDLGIAGVIPSTVLMPTIPGARLVGPALTVLNRRRAIEIADAATARDSRLGEIEGHNLARPGDVLVIQGVAGISSMGGLSASIGKRQGEAGVVIDGAVRDVARSRELGLPIWSRGLSPITGKWRIETVAVNVPVRIAEILVHPGDIAIADENGVCFIPLARAADVLAVARRNIADEERRQAIIDAGTPVPDLVPPKK
jgi:4-hydroxy-4-methyl-2-oxoglutarate aldolase